MSDLELAQVALVRTTGFSSWLTRIVLHTHWNHTVLTTGDSVVISAEPSGVQRMPAQSFPGMVVSQFIFKAGQAEAAIAFAEDQLGKPYSVFTYVWIGIARLTHWRIPAWVERRISSQNTWICSALCDSALTAGGYHLFRDQRPIGAVTPADIARVFYDFGWVDQP